MTKDSQDVAAARREAASNINLPSRSCRTTGRRVVFCLLLDVLASEDVVVSCVGGSFLVLLRGSGGFLGFGGLAGSSE